MSDPAILRAAYRSSSTLEADLRMISDGELSWDNEPDFATLIRGKRIAIVGPARTLIGRNGGEWIDSHDLVVRFNDPFTYLKESNALPEDHGSRTDVLYFNQVVMRNILAGIFAKREFREFAHESKLKYAVCTNNSLSYAQDGGPSARCEKKDMDVPKRFERFLADKVPGARFRVVTMASSLVIKWLKGNWGRTGFVALVDLLGFQPAHLSIVGMTFYHGGGHMATEGPELSPRGNRDGSSSISPSGFGHDSSLELVVLQDLMTAFGSRISIDGPLQNLIASLERSNP